ncbi:hypothetical protein SteCoe_23381 [Stentor coeruleus]|uniref:FCP1 homology domain-containing protein n=1 Tax=Stentor coeruleus TaxID=5963 RepID=A0A1R2BK14_9CILI|nr:hypothetical protein SteCoe_23381 [Stentor coeruleus]
MHRHLRPLNLDNYPKPKNLESIPHHPSSSRAFHKPQLSKIKLPLPLLTRRISSQKNLSIGVIRISKKKQKDYKRSSETSPLSSLQNIQNLNIFLELFTKKPKDISDLSKVITSLPMQIDYLNKVLYLPKSKENEGKKTLFLDLDETLAHAVKIPNQGQVKIKVNDDLILNVNIRPYAQDFIKIASQDYEIVIFTASYRQYANAILDYLDPLNKYIAYRLYREHCYDYNGYFIKDLRILGNRDLKDMILVDNSLVSFALQIENGIPISPWTVNSDDSKLCILLDYLYILKGARDVRCVNRNVFGLSKLITDSLSGNID